MELYVVVGEEYGSHACQPPYFISESLEKAIEFGNNNKKLHDFIKIYKYELNTYNEEPEKIMTIK